MKYMGSKARHAKELLPIILKNRKEGQWYVEPFVGGANMIDKVDGKRVGADINEYLVAMWQAVQRGWMPPDYITPEEYKIVRENKDTVPKAMVGWVAHCCSYNGKWFGGFAGKLVTKEGNTRNYQAEARNAVLKQNDKMADVTFVHKSYNELNFPSPCVIYCDPPYRGTTKYKDDFDHDAFYEWCRSKHKEGHQVFISEYNMPDDFVCLWSKEVNNSLTKDTGSKKGVEKLYTLE
jgi:DNA adenine methylase